MTPYAAGWRTADDPDAGPSPCPGSGQLVNPWAVVPPCPSCGRRLTPDPYAHTLPRHFPDADGAPPLSLWSPREEPTR